MSLLRRARGACWQVPAALALGAALAACGVSAEGAGSASKTGSQATTTKAAAPVGKPGPLDEATGGTRREVADPKEAESYPAPASARHAPAGAPQKAAATIVAAG